MGDEATERNIGIDLAPDGRDEVHLTMSAPDGWDMVDELALPLAALAVEPDHDLPFRASLSVTVDTLATGIGLNGWQKEADRMLARSLAAYLLLDLERTAVGSADGARRLATYRSPDGLGVTVEQWVLTCGNRGVTISATSATMAYPSYRGLWRACVDSLRLDERSRQ